MSRIMTAGVIMSLLLVTGSCTNEDQSDSYLSGLSFRATIENAQPTVGRMISGGNNSTQEFTEGDKIGLYAAAYQSENEPKPLAPSLNSADNALYKAEGTSSLVFNSPTPVRFPSGSVKKLDLYAYYPYGEAGFQSGTTQLPVAVNIDQSSEDNFWQSDFMTAEEKNVTQQRATATDDTRLVFKFAHRFSLVHFQVKQGLEFTSLDDLGTPTLQVINLATNATFDWAKSGNEMLLPITASNTNTIIPYGALAKNGEVFSGMTALLVPQNISKETAICEVKAANMTFYCKLSDDFVLEGGKSYTFTLMLNKSEVSGITSQIAAWNTSNIKGNASPNYPEIND